MAADGGGIAHDAIGAITINSTIVARNHDSSGPATPDLFGDVAADFSLIGNSAGGIATGAHNLVGTAAHPIDPKLGPLANNGGPTKTHALLPGSPALNAGANVDGLTFDQRGHGFNRVVGSAPDIGAYEAQNHGHHDGDGHDSAIGGDLSSTVKSPDRGIIGASLSQNRHGFEIPTRFSAESSGDRNAEFAEIGLYSRTSDNSTDHFAYRADFDFNSDGSIGIADFGPFSVRFFSVLR
jgi:hypothetical protein